jgi:hypothetical protein
VLDLAETRISSSSSAASRCAPYKPRAATPHGQGGDCRELRRNMRMIRQRPNRRHYDRSRTNRDAVAEPSLGPFEPRPRADFVLRRIVRLGHSACGTMPIRMWWRRRKACVRRFGSVERSPAALACEVGQTSGAAPR